MQIAKGDFMNGLPAEKIKINAADQDIAAAKRVVNIEINGLKALEASLGDDVALAIRILSKVTGRAVVTGMGKSGHVARKIAATLASTGTPAFFVHPAEASHGDLGHDYQRRCCICIIKLGRDDRAC